MEVHWTFSFLRLLLRREMDALIVISLMKGSVISSRIEQIILVRIPTERDLSNSLWDFIEDKISLMASGVI